MSIKGKLPPELKIQAVEDYLAIRKGSTEIIKLHARSSHHEGQKPASVVDWRRTVQGRFFYDATSALIKLVSCSPVEPQIVQPGLGKRTHSKEKP